MPEALTGVLATPGLVWLVLTYLVAGVVRGFSGFGTALIFMPVATIFLPVPVAVVVITVSGFVSLPVLLPRALREGDVGQVAVLALAALVTLPIGVRVLAVADNETTRWIVVIAAAATLAALVSGWRFTGRVTRPGLVIIGAIAGLLGGMTGLTGPVVILFYLAGRSAASAVRANVILFLAFLDVGVIVNLWLAGLAGGDALALGLVLMVPYAIAISVGQRLFTPTREVLYRRVAFGVIALAIVTGLPIFG